MTSPLEHDATHCPRCDHDLDYRLDAVRGGGLRYTVSCSSCGQLVYDLCTPLVDLPAAA